MSASPAKTVLPSNPPKSPVIAAVLSFILFGGVGHIYLGQVTKGIVICVASLLLSFVFVGVIIWLVAIYDAYQIGMKLQSGQAVGEWEFFFQK